MKYIVDPVIYDKPMFSKLIGRLDYGISDGVLTFPGERYYATPSFYVLQSNNYDFEKLKNLPELNRSFLYFTDNSSQEVQLIHPFLKYYAEFKDFVWDNYHLNVDNDVLLGKIQIKDPETQNVIWTGSPSFAFENADTNQTKIEFNRVHENTLNFSFYHNGVKQDIYMIP